LTPIRMLEKGKRKRLPHQVPGAATVRERADVSIFAFARMLTHGGSVLALSGHARTSVSTETVAVTST
jgi:hypothetical protein